jgi:pyruvate,water dikinase
MSRARERRRLPRALRALLAVAALALPRPSVAEGVALASIEPTRIEAGSWYDGATVHVHGSVGERSQVAIRVTGPEEHHTFNRRGKIGGLVWGGVEHVSFEHTPSLYAVYTSAALGSLAPKELREQLRLGYDALEGGIRVHASGATPGALISQLVLLKESEGLYRISPGAVHLDDARLGRRTFEAAVPIPSGAAPGTIEIAVLELSDGAVLAHELHEVTLARVGMPAVLFQLAHEQSTLFGMLAVLVLVVTGVGVDLIGSRRASRPHPALVLLTGIARGVDDLAPRRRTRSLDEVERMHAKYRLFRTLLAVNNEVLENLTELEEESSWTSFRHPRVRMGIRAMFDGTADMVGILNELTSNRYFDLTNVVKTLRADVFRFLERASEREQSPLTIPLRQIRSETASQVGDKALHLARVECDLGLLVPDSFVVTVAAYREFMEAGQLAGQLRTVLAPARLDAPDDFRRRCEVAQELVRETPVPPAISDAIQRAWSQAGIPPGEGLAVRSSAVGEGSTLSFAGQFESLLNVPPEGLVDAWRRVVASRYSPRAVFYRRAAGLADVDTPMAVLVQRMVPARAAGVLFTRRPDEPKGQAVLVSAAPGLGPDVSTGIASADAFVISRAPPHRVVERRIAAKHERLVRAGPGGLAPVPVDPDERLRPSIDDAEATALAQAALAVERYFGAPQDVEWVIAEDGRVVLLQARTLRTAGPTPAEGELPAGARTLVRGGDPAWHGRAVGKVHVARTPAELEETPPGALLVTAQLLPDCVRILPRVCGVVVERGTITGHAASLVREFRVPSLFGAAGALDAVAPGAVASLDSSRRSLYEGELWPELRGRTPAAASGQRAQGLPELLAGKLTKLTGAAFVGTWACQSLHDVVRFAHEKAIQEMFEIGDRLLDSPVGGMKAVDCAEPLFVQVVDLGAGIREGAATGESVRPADIASFPFQALWRGLADPDFDPRRPERPPPSASVLAATLAISRAADRGAPNYACITDSYLNLNSRGGIEWDRVRARPRRQANHYVVVDSYLSENANENHIRLRLKGGGAAPWQRRLRSEVAAEILKLHGFSTAVTGDLMNGWIAAIDRPAGAAALATIGHLLRFIARLDMWMTEEADVRRRVQSFVDAEALAATAAAEAAATAPPGPLRSRA